MEVDSKLHAPAALPRETKPVPIKQEAVWAQFRAHTSEKM
jgi:hypothetical protein